MTISPATECEGCGRQIGESSPGAINDHVVCKDGMSSKIVTFHKSCHMRLSQQAGSPAADPDLQRIHRVTLAPVVLNANVKELVS